jgi:hypothetical protein
MTAGTGPKTTSVLSHKQGGENRTTVSMCLFRSLGLVIGPGIKACHPPASFILPAPFSHEQRISLSLYGLSVAGL